MAESINVRPTVGRNKFKKQLDPTTAGTWEKTPRYLYSSDPLMDGGLEASAVYVVDPAQAGTTPLVTATVLKGSPTDGNNFLCVITGRAFDNGISTALLADKNMVQATQTSAVAGTNVLTLDTRGLNKTLALNITSSGGVAPTFGVLGSIDNSTFLTLDTGLAIGPKQYVEATVGATLALSPLSFRFIRISVTAAAAGNTSTIVAAMK